MSSPRRSTARGVNTFWTRRRSRVWSGGSSASSDHSSCSWNADQRGSGSGRPSSAWVKRCVYARPMRRSRSAAAMSAKRVSIHCWLASFQKIGVASRNAFNTGYGSAMNAGSDGSKWIDGSSAGGTPTTLAIVPSCRPAGVELGEAGYPRGRGPTRTWSDAPVLDAPGRRVHHRRRVRLGRLRQLDAGRPRVPRRARDAQRSDRDRARCSVRARRSTGASDPRPGRDRPRRGSGRATVDRRRRQCATRRRVARRRARLRVVEHRFRDEGPAQAAPSSDPDPRCRSRRSFGGALGRRDLSRRETTQEGGRRRSSKRSFTEGASADDAS